MSLKNIKLDCENFISAEYALPKKAGEDFGEIFTRYLSELRLLGVTQNEISEVTGLEATLISKLKNGRKRPTFRAVILLSLAMKLSPERSEYLLRSVGFALNDCMEHRIYKLFLQGCAFSDDYSIKNCNLLLAKHGFSMLSIDEKY